MIYPLGNKQDDTESLMNYFRANSPGRAELGPGDFYTTGLKLAALSCSIRGCEDATRINLISGSENPIMDFTGYYYPKGGVRSRTISDFCLIGDNIAHPAKKGILLGDVSFRGAGNLFGVSSMTFKNISIEKTGDCCLEVGSSNLCNFINITLNTPADCVANDTPYIRGTSACNGNLFHRIGIRSLSTSNDCPPSGAARFVEHSDKRYIWTPGGNEFSSWWYEYVHPSNNSTLFTIQGYLNTIKDFKYFDVTKEPSANRTSAFRILRPTKGNEDYGANEIDSFIFGALQPGLDSGVEVYQPYNSIRGSKGKGGRNVVLFDEAKSTSIMFMGSLQYEGNKPAVVGGNYQPTTLDGSITILDCIEGYYYLGNVINPTQIDMGNRVGRIVSVDGFATNEKIKFLGNPAIKNDYGAAIMCVDGNLIAVRGRDRKSTRISEP